MTKNITLSIILSFLFIFTGFSKQAVQNTDSLETTIEIQTNLDQNLDSLLHLWYLKNAIKTDYSTSNEKTDSIIPEFHDSIYIFKSILLLPHFLKNTFRYSTF